jgi:O-antigen/teichoic acid export membrane protein
VRLLSAEGYVRKAAALKLDCPSEVARSEIAGAVVFAVGTVIAVALQSDVDVVVVVGLMFGAKHLVELLSVRTWRPMFARDGSLARSGPEWLGQVFTYLTANADYVVLGVMLGAADLSRYVISFRFASAMPALVANPITQGAFVDLAEATEEDHRQTAYDTVVRRALSTGVLAAIGLMAAAPALQAVLGEAWSGTAALIVVLALSVPFRLLLGATIAQAITAGAARQVVMWEFGRLVLVTTAAVVGASFSLMAATAAISVATIVSVTGEHRLAASVSGTRMDRRLVPAAGMAVAAVIVVAVVFSN